MGQGPSYSPENSKMEKIMKFASISSIASKIGSVFGLWKAPLEPLEPPEQMKEEPVDPLMAELKPLLGRIEALKKEAQEYSSEHINQDFRRIDAELNVLLTKLDSAKVPADRTDARDLRRQGYRENDAAVKLLWKEIHDTDVAQCDICLPLG